jgi:hypothetical protein
MIPNEIKAIAHGITEAIKQQLPNITPLLFIDRHNCEININKATEMCGMSVGTHICKIDLDSTIEIIPKHAIKATTKIDYADPQFIEKIITTIKQLITQNDQEYNKLLHNHYNHT